MRYSKTARKAIALTLLTVLTTQLLAPNVALALTSGPSQPEVQGFEPVGTSDMVDMFSGDFNYNIPLLDVEGYPVNISYHGGVTMEQEASWVGLGWNINPGEVNRTVRGVPDDFNGDTLSKELHIKDERTLRAGVGVGVEFFGVGDPLLSASASLGADVTFNNYRGTSVDFNLGGGVNVFNSASIGVNIGVGSATGADIDYNANLSLSSALLLGRDMGAGIGVGVGQGYSTRSGIKDLNFSYSINTSMMGQQTFNGSIPIGVKNFVPVITNSSTMVSISGRIKLGGEFMWCYGYGSVNGTFSTVKYNNDGSRDAYGYLYLQNMASTNKSILDFTRDHDGQFNKTMQYLPPANLTYDIYSVSGQGTGGVFRPYRNDFGTVYDPVTQSQQNSYSAELEGGLGWIFEVGGDFVTSETKLESGPWTDYLRGFTSRANGSIYENTYLKQGGELTSVDPQYFTDINKFSPLVPESLPSLGATKANSTSHRDARGNLIYYFTAAEDTASGVGTNPNIVSYTSTDGFASGANAATTNINRIGSTPLDHKKDEISEIVQVQKDGKKYVYGIPAMNHIQKEATFSVTPPAAGSDDLAKGTVTFNPSVDDGPNNTNGIDQYYSGTVTPAYAHSYLLTSVLSPDYVDVTGDGITDDDLGAYTKMNYTLKENDYRWRAPFESTKAQYDPGFRSYAKDDKGSYMSGSREEWILHSIETKNFIAEFYTSGRNDACGSTAAIATTGRYAVSPYKDPVTAAKSYQLDSIRLYNKHDRFINKTNAIPVKTVYFVYTDTLCRGIPNTLSPGHGKLTLSRIYFKYGSSEKSMISPYEFSYGYNPNYDISCKDRWGSYKPNSSSGISNYEFPFVNQSDDSNDVYASAWSLTDIRLPSGGAIHTHYEADDYGFVQDKPAHEMFKLEGVGNGPGFSTGTKLYADENSPYLYFYFSRRNAAEINSAFAKNYFPDGLLYYNFNVKLNSQSNSSYEQIKGYAEIEEVGACDNVHGYVKVKPIAPDGDEGSLNPVTYTALNTARYELPQIIYPGSESGVDGFDILDGLSTAWDELISILHNPIVHMVQKKNYAKAVNLSKSFMRLQSPGLKKVGGGHRVGYMLFYDNWHSLAGGNEQDAAYGKKYDYTMKDDTWGSISSGVASYEPMIGGDENPFRSPVPYIVQSGSHFPPNDPVSLYQETPIGESLFPSPSVGYRHVAVTSINSGIGRSAQGIDIYEFYTAKDFPVKFQASAINTNVDHHFDFFSQKNGITATQGYTLITNDMHGKPKSTQHYVHLAGGTNQLISYQNYNYKMNGNDLDNNVNCLAFNPTTSQMEVKNMQLGVESDVTIDSRYRNEATKTNTYNCNLNLSGFLFIIFPIFFGMHFEGDYTNQFHCAAVTKTIQQYGILDNVQSYNEGAVTTVSNEVFDPETGQVVVTSVNNEYKDKEYSVNIPAYWAYKGMGPGYENIKYETTLPSITIDANRRGEIPTAGYLNVGDEILINYSYSGVPVQTTGWVIGLKPIYAPIDQKYTDCHGYILPRFPKNVLGWNTGGTLTGVHIKVISSGCKNLLGEIAESYTTMDQPWDGTNTLTASPNNVISIKAKTFSDSGSRFLLKYLSVQDTVNPFALGARGIYRVNDEYVYQKDRQYSGTTARNQGLFQADRLFSSTAIPVTPCNKFPYNYLAPISVPEWVINRTITKWSPNGKEVENRDAVGNYSTAIFGYNEELPVAVLSNAKQGEGMAEGFEDYMLLRYKNSLLPTSYSPFIKYFGSSDLSTPSPIYNLFNLSNPSDISIVSNTAHTGLYSLSVPVSSGGITGVYAMNIPVDDGTTWGGDLFDDWYPTSSLVNASNAYLPFRLSKGKTYILSFWVKQNGGSVNPTTYTLHDSCGMKIGAAAYGAVRKSNIIDGWQQMEVTFTVPTTATTAAFRMPVNYYVDDVRFFPIDANMKSFVYNPVNEKLMATLDENNFATLYEYDAEGNLVRTKKETEKGVMTVSESRSNNPKNQ